MGKEPQRGFWQTQCCPTNGFLSRESPWASSRSDPGASFSMETPEEPAKVGEWGGELGRGGGAW